MKHLYEGLDSCWADYKPANRHWDISQVGQPMTPERKEALDRYLAPAEKYFYYGELFCVRQVFTEVSYWVKNGMAYRLGSLLMLPGISTTTGMTRKRINDVSRRFRFTGNFGEIAPKIKAARAAQITSSKRGCADASSFCRRDCHRDIDSVAFRV